MSLPEKVVNLFRRFGKPARFAAKTVLCVALPGSGAVIELVDSLLDCAHETVKDQYEFNQSQMPAATAEDLQRVEQILDVLQGEQTAAALLVS